VNLKQPEANALKTLAKWESSLNAFSAKALEQRLSLFD
jgi:hypothetical protein